MEEFPDEIHEQREELLVPSAAESETSTLTQAHFLRPTAATMDEPGLKHPSHSLSTKNPSLNLERLVGKVCFRAWRRPGQYWKKWVQSLHSKYHSLWKKAGIYEAIMFSTYEIEQHKALVLGIAEKWNPETNTFVLPWGETTITLEDVMLSGGFSVLGESVLGPLCNRDMLEVRERLCHARREAGTGSAYSATHNQWMRLLRGSRHQLEHEAFLSIWLSRFVFVTPRSHIFIEDHVFDVAIRLARGIRIALATDVLCAIYRDLRRIVEELFFPNDPNNGFLELCAPLQLVQVWVWERYPMLRPTPNSLSCSEPRVARWHGLKVEHGDVRQAIDLAGESFQWRPYCLAVKNWNFPKFYGDKAQWIVTSNDNLDEEFESFARCLRPSKLLGRECLEQYLPHRVAMQFGFDQDIPGFVRCDGDDRVAWENYSRPTGGTVLYIPPRLLEADVTKRYSDWWKGNGNISSQCDFLKPFPRRHRNAKRTSLVSVSKEEYYNRIPATRYPVQPQVVCNGTGGSVEESEHTAVEKLNKDGNACVGVPLPVCKCHDLSDPLQDEETKTETDDNEQVKKVKAPSIASEITTENETRCHTVELPRLEIEDRICRLEMLVIKLKAKRDGK